MREAIWKKRKKYKDIKEELIERTEKDVKNELFGYDLIGYFQSGLQREITGDHERYKIDIGRITCSYDVIFL